MGGGMVMYGRSKRGAVTCRSCYGWPAGRALWDRYQSLRLDPALVSVPGNGAERPRTDTITLHGDLVREC